MYVAGNNVACTSLKCLVPDLQDERRERVLGTLAGEVSRDDDHRRNLWEKTPMLAIREVGSGDPQPQRAARGHGRRYEGSGDAHPSARPAAKRTRPRHSP